MQFSKIAIFSLVALVTAMPNAEPVPEPHQIEARTFSFLWGKEKGCDCKCSEGNYKRDNELEARTFWLFPSKDKDNCDKECGKKCDDYYDGKEKDCEKDAKDKFSKCWEGCKYKKDHKRNTPCQKECKIEYKDANNWCDKKWGH